MSVLIFSSCNSNPRVDSESGNDTESSFNNGPSQTAFTLEEYYEPSEFDTNGYEWITNVCSVNDKLFITGGKAFDHDKRCLIITDNNDEYKSINLDINYSSVKDACIVGDTLYVLHEKTVSSVDFQNGKLINEFEIKEDVSNIQSDGVNFFLKRFTADIIYIYDSDFQLIKSVKIPELISSPKDMENFRLLKTKDRLYIAGDCQNIITLYVLDNNLELIFSKDYSDLPGMPYSIYDDGNSIILISNNGYTDPDTGSFSVDSYIDVIDRNDGSVKERYESFGTQFVYWNFYRKEIITRSLDGLSVSDLESKEKHHLLLPENYETANICQSSENIILFESSNAEISNCLTNILPSGEKKEYVLDPDINNVDITENGDYCFSKYDNDGTIDLIFKNDRFETVRSVKLNLSENCDISGSTRISYCGNKIYAAGYDGHNTPQIAVFDEDGNYISVHTLECSKIYKILNNNKVLYIVCDNNNRYEVLKMTDSGPEPLPFFSILDITGLYDGDDSYDLYYALGSVVYGYNDVTNTGTRILSFIDSGISNIGGIFTKISDNTYVCDTYSENSVNMLQLKKADDETVERMNKRKIIVVAGDTVNWNSSVFDAVAEFNRNSRDHYIVTHDYSETTGSGISSFSKDVINGIIPDLFISGGSLNTKTLENFNALENLKEYIENSDITFRSFYHQNDEENEIHHISPLIGFGLIADTDSSSDLKGCISTDDFLKTVTENNMKFSECSKYQLFDYLIIDNLGDYIDYDNSKCNFTSDTFIHLLEYIKNAESENGTLKLKIYNNIYELKNFPENCSYFDISANALYSSHINEFIKMSIYDKSKYKDISWEIIKSVFKASNSVQETGIPVYTSHSDESLNNEALSSLLMNGKITEPADNNILNILYSELDLFFDGEVTASEYADNINCKTELYLNEQR